MSELATTYRVMANQWAMEFMRPTRERAEADAAEAFEDRLHPHDLDVREHQWVSAEGEVHTMGFTVWTRRWSPVAEATTRDLAEGLAEELIAREDIAECVVVERNSAAEHEMGRYGTVRL